MRSLRSLWVVAPSLLGACSVINAPGEINPGTSSSGGGGTGATGGGGSGGATTTTTTSTGGGSTTTVEPVCGDGKVTGAEACDDDNTVAGDGCSSKCEVEAGYTCTDALEELSICTKLCGNGILDADEECDDKDQGDTNPAPGDQDFCTATCIFKEFDIEAGMAAAAHNDFPTVGFRRDKDSGGVDSGTFLVLWHSATLNKLQGRQYKFDGTYLKGTAAVDIAVTPNPDSSGHRICTASTNRSLIFWRDATDKKVYSRKIESNGMTTDPVATAIVNPEANPSCAATGGGTFITATTAKIGALTDISLQAFTSFAAPSGGAVDVGDTLAKNNTAAWGLPMSFMTAWVVDPAGNGVIVGQLLDTNGVPLGGDSFFTLSAVDDVAPREPYGERIGMMDQAALVYTRDSLPDGAGATYREAVLRIFQTPGNGSAPFIVTADTNPQSQPRIAANPGNGKLVVVWTAAATGGENVFYRVFDQTGAALTAEKVASDSPLGQQTVPSVTVDPMTGDVVVVWDNFIPNSGKPHKVSAKILPGLLK